jgi:hypothetical protein
MRFGLEIWTPTSAAERKAFAALEQVLADAMHAVLGLRSGPGKWIRARRLKREVLCLDFAVPSMRSESDIARVRFRCRIDPARRRAPPGGVHPGVALPALPTVWPPPSDLP